MQKIKLSKLWVRGLMLTVMFIGYIDKSYSESLGHFRPYKSTYFNYTGDNWTVINNKISGSMNITFTGQTDTVPTTRIFRCNITNGYISDYFSRYATGYDSGGRPVIVDKNIVWPTGDVSKITGLKYRYSTGHAIVDLGSSFVMDFYWVQFRKLDEQWRANGYTFGQKPCNVGDSYTTQTAYPEAGKGAGIFEILFDVPVGMNLTAGRYNLKMKVSSGSYRIFSGTGPIPMPSLTEYSAMRGYPVEVNVSVTIVNKCSVSSQILNLDHKTIAMNIADGNIARGNIQLKCDYDTSGTYSLITDGIKTKEYTEVNLGNNWTSELSVTNGTTQSSSGTFTTSSGAAVITVASKLRQNANSMSGSLNGSGVLSINVD